MEPLSQILSLIPINGHVDARCTYGAPWKLEQPDSARFTIPYHVVLSGEVVLEDERRPSLTLLAGSMVLYTRGEAHVLHDGSGAEPSIVHSRRDDDMWLSNNDSDASPVDVLCGRFTVDEVSDRLIRQYLPDRLVVQLPSDNEPAGRNKTTSGSIDQSRYVRLIGLMRDELHYRQPGYRHIIDHFSAALFGFALRHASQKEDAPQGLLLLAQHAKLRPAIEAMLDAPSYSWTLTKLADLCHMSRASFVRHFTNALGHSAKEFLAQIRIAIASLKLATTNEPVSSIVETSGYESEAAFYRLFKKHTGYTPSKWRSVNQKRHAQLKTP